MDIQFNHQLEYGIEGPVSVEDIVQSLYANEQLLREAVIILERTIPGLNIEPGFVAVREVSKHSPLRELLAFAVVMTFQEDLKKEVPKLFEDLTGVGISDKYDTLITVLVMLIAIYAISAVATRITGKRPEKLDRDRERLITVAGNYINVSPQELESAITDSVEGKRRSTLESSAKRFFRPVKGRPNTGIKTDQDPGISSDAIAEVPSDAMVAASEVDEPFRTEFVKGVTIELHAMDRDRLKLGWAGHVRGVTGSRIKMILDKSISPESLFGKKLIRGDILMVYLKFPDGSETEKEFHLLRLSSSGRPPSPRKA